MPLHDHFRPPLAPVRSWESFHASWAVAIRNRFNRTLPARFVAEAPVHLGAQVAADVAEVDTWPETDADGRPPVVPDPEGGGLAVLTPPAVTVAADIGLLERFAVEVRDRSRNFRLAGVVELVSPSNKTRPDHRHVFVGKAAGYLLAGVGLVIADVVTERRANLHNELLAINGTGPEHHLPGSPPLYAAAYAPVPAGDRRLLLDVWAEPLAVGRPLPTLPLQVLGLGRVPVDLEASYMEACEWSRIPA
jgi:hypothetical protein